MKTYVPVVDRNSGEDKVLWWGMSKTNYGTIMSFFCDPDIGDITSPTEGFDLKLTYTVGSNHIPMPRIDAGRRPSKLTSNREKTKGLLESVPDIESALTRKTEQEITEILDAWANPPEDDSVSTTANKDLGMDHLSNTDSGSDDSVGVSVGSVDDIDEMLSQDSELPF
jgi:hypothetical protein